MKIPICFPFAIKLDMSMSFVSSEEYREEYGRSSSMAPGTAPCMATSSPSTS